MSSTGYPKPDPAASCTDTADELVTINTFPLFYKTAINGDRIRDFHKEGKFVDVTLKFGDGRLLSGHRCVLADASGYFDNLFSNGMKESRVREIHVKGVSSSLMATALEYIYNGNCPFPLDNFFELLLLANMLELKKIEDGLLNHFKRSQSDFRECPTEEARNAKRQGVVDFLVDAWVFCRQYPVLGKSLYAEKPSQYWPAGMHLQFPKGITLQICFG